LRSAEGHGADGGGEVKLLDGGGKEVLLDGGMVPPDSRGQVGTEAARSCMVVELLQPAGPGEASLPFPNPRAGPQGIRGDGGGGGGDGHG